MVKALRQQLALYRLFLLPSCLLKTVSLILLQRLLFLQTYFLRGVQEALRGKPLYLLQSPQTLSIFRGFP
jgi:hypothetical protein